MKKTDNYYLFFAFRGKILQDILDKKRRASHNPLTFLFIQRQMLLMLAVNCRVNHHHLFVSYPSLILLRMLYVRKSSIYHKRPIHSKDPEIDSLLRIYGDRSP